MDAEPHQLKLHLGDAGWHAETRRDVRTFAIGCNVATHKLVLDSLVPGDRLSRIVVFVPVPGDDSWLTQIQALRQAITKIDAGPAKTKAWARWHELRSYCCDLRSAACLTVHRAEGCTFRNVWIAGDLAWCQTTDARALHYTSITRASQAVHLLRRQGSQRGTP
ncbi:ATP-binding domain-containing protein [Vulcanococcus limneticus]|uniref:ATP-binding domain-containing protein n=1 Tax=Vulcanococcus limneticus TaxID=2170428 RepID=UPI00398BCF2B